MSAVMEQPILDKVQAFARQARLASVSKETLQVAPDVASVLADYLQKALATTEDQAWFGQRNGKRVSGKQRLTYRPDVTRSLTRWKT